jgi:hypothetical protein
MVYLNTVTEVTDAFAHTVGCCDYAGPAHCPDGQTALRLANLEPGESAFELGTRSGHLIAVAKQAIGAGVYYGSLGLSVRLISGDRCRFGG